MAATSWNHEVVDLSSVKLHTIFKFRDYNLGPFDIQHWENKKRRFLQLESVASAVIRVCTLAEDLGFTKDQVQQKIEQFATLMKQHNRMADYRPEEVMLLACDCNLNSDEDTIKSKLTTLQRQSQDDISQGLQQRHRPLIKRW